MQLKNEELIVKAKAGDKEAEREFFESNKKFSFYIAKKFANTNVEIDDLAGYAQIGFLKAYHTFDPSKDIKFATYSSRCMINEILMFLRRNKKHAYIDSLDRILITDGNGNGITLREIIPSDENIEDEVELSMISTSVKDFVFSLPERDRLIIIMKFEEGKTQAEIGNALGISQSYISRICKRLRNRIKRYIEKGEGVVNKPKIVNLNPKLVNKPIAKKIIPPTPKIETPKIETIKDAPKINKPIIKEMENMTKANPKISQVKFINENYPQLKAKDIAIILGVGQNTVATYKFHSKSEDIKPDASIKDAVEAYIAKQLESKQGQNEIATGLQQAAAASVLEVPPVLETLPAPVVPPVLETLPVVAHANVEASPCANVGLSASLHGVNGDTLLVLLSEAVEIVKRGGKFHLKIEIGRITQNEE